MELVVGVKEKTLYGDSQISRLVIGMDDVAVL